MREEERAGGRQPRRGRTAAADQDAVVVVRPARDEDLSKLHRVDRLVFGRLAYPLFTLRQLMDLHGRHCMVADAGDKLVGYCLAGLAAKPCTGWVLGLGVLPQLRGRGLGRDLVESTMRQLVLDGATAVNLAVEPANVAAIQLYESLGFRVQSYSADYFGRDHARLIMTASAAPDRVVTSPRATPA